MADDATAQAEPRKRSAKTDPTPLPTLHVSEPPLAIDIRNPRGDLLHVRVPLVVAVDDKGALDHEATAEATYAGLQALLDQLFVDHDVTAAFMAGFNPAVMTSLENDEDVATALGLDKVSDLTADTYAAFKRGGRRASGGGGDGRKRSGGGGDRKPVDTATMADSAFDELPKAFREELDRGGCPSCGETKFWDNRNDPDRGQGPLLACANRDGCEGGGAKRDGGHFPWAWFGGEKKEGGSRRRGRGD